MADFAEPLRQRLVNVCCDLCGSDSTRTVMRKRAVLFQHDFSIVQCRVCRHIYVNPRLKDDTIDSLYDEDYYEGRGFDRTIRYTAREPDDYVLEKYRDELETIRGALGGTLSSKATLDVGCGSGAFVRALRLAGAEAWGFDSSPYSSKLAIANGAPLIAANIGELVRYEGQYDLVSAIEVIEHTTSPLEFLVSIRRLLRPGGVLFLETGNWNLVRLVPGTPYVMPEGHLHYFNPKTLSAFLAKAGFEVLRPMNYTWAGWRLVGKRLGPIGASASRVAAAAARTLVPVFGPFPLGRRPGS